jgi:prepilin-type N-terminal cleavage/methylation domain-containing protein
MKKINYLHTKIITAFTLIELLVVITIITIISTSGIFYFFDFVKNQEINQKIYVIENDINLLGKEIKNYKIFDYELIFNTSDSTNKSYIIYTNIFDTEKQTLEITNST